MKKPQSSETLKDLSEWEDIVEGSVLKVSIDKRRYGKSMTVIEGFDSSSVNLKELTKILKRNVASGGTYKDGHIELQGDHRAKVKKILEGVGYNVELI